MRSVLAAACLAAACAPLATAPAVVLSAPAAPLAPVYVGERPIRPVPAYGAIWVANASAGRVLRIDPLSGRTTSIRVADPHRLIAAGCAPSSEHAYATGSFGLRACDAPSAIAAGGGAIWATGNDARTIVRIDPAEERVTASIAVGFVPWSVVASDDAVWVSDYTSNAVVRIDPHTMLATRRLAVAAGPTELAIAPGVLWVLSSAAGVLTRIDTVRDAIVTTIALSPWAVDVAAFGDDVWVRGGAGSGSAALVQIDARTDRITRTHQSGALLGREGVGSIAATARGVWVPGLTLDLIARDTGEVLDSVPSAGYAVAIDGAVLWSLDVFGRLVRSTPLR